MSETEKVIVMMMRMDVEDLAAYLDVEKPKIGKKKIDALRNLFQKCLELAQWKDKRAQEYERIKK